MIRLFRYHDKALSIDTNNVQALINKGRSLSQLHRFEEAITDYDKALQIEPKNIDALINKGLSLYNLGKNNDAITYFDKVLTIDPNNTFALNLKNSVKMNSKGVQ